jgi:hypothetical protein
MHPDHALVTHPRDVLSGNAAAACLGLILYV